MAAHEARNRELRSILDTGDHELVEIVRVRLAREKNLARTARSLAEELADTTAAALSARTDPVIDAHWDDREMVFLQRVARALVETAPESCGLLTSVCDGDLLFIVFTGDSAAIDIAEVGPRVAEALGGRGGGRGSIFQGKAESLSNRDEALAILRG